MKTRITTLLLAAALAAGLLAGCATDADTTCERNTVPPDPATAGQMIASDSPSPAPDLTGETVTRLAFLQALADADGVDLSAVGDSHPFADAGPSPALSWAWDAWLVNGSAADTFRPDDPITRQEAAAVLSRYLDCRYTALPGGCGTGQPDVSDAAGWARDAILHCWMYGVVPSGDFRPAERLTGSDAAAWINAAANVSAATVAAPGEPGFADRLAGAAAPETGNWLLSPYSARLALAMAANGAAGETRQQLLDALQIDDLDDFNAETEALLARYESIARAVTLDTANAVWLNETQLPGVTLRPAYKSLLREHFGAEVGTVTDANSVETVNAWADQATQGRIPAILTEDNRQFAAVLANAVYFRAAWQETFSEHRTAAGVFANEDGTTAEADFLHGVLDVGYFADGTAQIVRLDFARTASDPDGENFVRFPDADFSMYLVLPGAAWPGGAPLDALLDQAAFTDGPVRLTIPKFTLEYGGTLNDALQALGVSDAFDPDAADFSAMADAPLFVDTVLQKTYLSVDENGAEAAAVTAIAMEDTDAPPEGRDPMVRTFTADRPFYLAIRDNTTGELLFAGYYGQAA